MINILKRKLKEIGGEEAIRKAIVWDWLMRTEIEDLDDLKSAFLECKECYEKTEALRGRLKGVYSKNENSTNFLS